VGLDWSNVQTVPGFAFGTQTGLNDVNDSTALLTGMWGSNQTAQATVVINVQGPHKEIELRLNSSLSAHVCTGYELSFEIDGLVNIVRWNGPFNNFTVIGAAKNLPGGALVTGDVLYGTNVGGLITAYVNGVQVNQVTDTTYTGGSPGIGFFLRTPSVTNSDFGVASFTATD
jgi:hypothetical protein